MCAEGVTVAMRGRRTCLLRGPRNQQYLRMPGDDADGRLFLPNGAEVRLSYPGG